jgi:hypothetical protein
VLITKTEILTPDFMDTTIVCPHCNQAFELTEAFKKDMESRFIQDKQKIFKEELALKDKKIEVMRSQELELLKKQRFLEDKQKDLEIDIQKRLLQERPIIEEAASKRAAETYRMQMAEKDKAITDLKNSLTEAQRKANQTSQQLQGEVQELDLEQLLRSNFRDDQIEPVGKGALGADIRQTVKTSKGTVCGIILWESKRTKAWSDSWISKLKEDTLRDKADLSAIVSEVVPTTVGQIGQIDGVHICLPSFILPLSALLRKILIDVARQKYFSGQRQDKAGVIYSYITSSEFSQQVESLISVYTEMQEELTKERTAFERIWKQRESQIQRLLSGVGGIYGYLQGVAGSALPPVSGLELPEGS